MSSKMTRCPARSCVTDAQCTMVEGHTAHHPRRFHNFADARSRQLIEKIETCSVCKAPTHASELNDFNVCESCTVRSFFSLPMMAHVAAAHVFLCHAGNADDCKDGCEANAADRRRMKLYIDIGDQVSLMRAAVARRNS